METLNNDYGGIIKKKIVHKNVQTAHEFYIVFTQNINIQI